MSTSKAVAVYCAASLGSQQAFHLAAVSVGHALAQSGRPLVYGGGKSGLMGLVSGAVLVSGGDVVGVRPIAMVKAGDSEVVDREEPGERDERVRKAMVVDRRKVEEIVVNSMHERKTEMARRSSGFLCLPGGFGTFEEALEVTTWTQIGIHRKPVVILNVLSYYSHLRSLIQTGFQTGFIHPQYENLITFIDGPPDHSAHETFDWGKAAIEAFDAWKREDIPPPRIPFDWTIGKDGDRREELEAS